VQVLSVDSDGCLVDPDALTEDWARETARAMGIELTPEHSDAIRFMRKFYEEDRTPTDARFVMRHLSETRGASRNRMFELFPYGYPGRPARSPACAELCGRGGCGQAGDDRRDEEPAILEKICRGERILHFETIRQRKDESLVDISLTISPIRDSRGQLSVRRKLRATSRNSRRRVIGRICR